MPAPTTGTHSSRPPSRHGTRRMLSTSRRPGFPSIRSAPRATAVSRSATATTAIRRGMGSTSSSSTSSKAPSCTPHRSSMTGSWMMTPIAPTSCATRTDTALGSRTPMRTTSIVIAATAWITPSARATTRYLGDSTWICWSSCTERPPNLWQSIPRRCRRMAKRLRRPGRTQRSRRRSNHRRTTTTVATTMEETRTRKIRRKRIRRKTADSTRVPA
mmetsp:Transcript_23764/g.66376  ORF Transcript_23764/g.66376 Transcript_23764/m.66376 type:complete len:216 (+) Transcript_23764:146-793(+)